MTIQDDPVIDEIREVRRRISEQFDHDPEKLVAYYIELQKQHQSRLMKAPGGSSSDEEDRLTEAELIEV